MTRVVTFCQSDYYIQRVLLDFQRFKAIKLLKMGLLFKITSYGNCVTEFNKLHIFREVKYWTFQNVTTKMMPCPGGKVDVIQLGVSNIVRKMKMLCISRAIKLESYNVVHIITGILCMIV